MELSQYRAEATLRDGTPIVIRAIQPEDRAALQEGFLRLSEAAVYQRFFVPKPALSDSELHYLTELDFHNHIGLLAEDPALDGLALIAVARAVRATPSQPGEPQTAEVAFLVADHYQGRGLGTLLLEHLVRLGRDRGYQRFRGEVLPTNSKMLAVLAHSGLPERSRLVEGVVHVELDLTASTQPRQSR
jgi:GNAT superfamily N-acetyltransferase